MIQTLLSPDGFGPAVLAIVLGWTPVFIPLVFVLIWGRALPKKLHFVATTSSFTLGLPVFFLIGLEAPLVVIKPFYDMAILEHGLHDSAPFTWFRSALASVARWWWLATIVAFIVSAVFWSSLVCWWLGRR